MCRDMRRVLTQLVCRFVVCCAVLCERLRSISLSLSLSLSLPLSLSLSLCVCPSVCLSLCLSLSVSVSISVSVSVSLSLSLSLLLALVLSRFVHVQPGCKLVYDGLGKHIVRPLSQSLAAMKHLEDYDWFFSNSHTTFKSTLLRSEFVFTLPQKPTDEVSYISFYLYISRSSLCFCCARMHGIRIARFLSHVCGLLLWDDAGAG
eukprot:COSAG05_NODE_214_length_13907_cov_28.992178_15_plen_204_part_00